MFENEIQKKNRNISGINAPAFEDYPENGRIDTDWLPLTLTWIDNVELDSSGSNVLATYRVEVYVDSVGQNTFVANKVACADWMLKFITEYRTDGCSHWISNDPPVAIIQDSVNFGSYRDVIKSPDGEEFHGFIFTFDVSFHADAVC